MSAQVLLDRLSHVRKTGPDRWVARCPAHDDRSPSLSVAFRPETGQTLIHCFAGCPTEDVLTAVGLTWQDVLPLKDPQRRVAPSRPRQRYFQVRRYVEDFVRITANMVNHEGYEPTDKDIAQLELFAAFLRGEIRDIGELRERVSSVGGRLPV